MLPTLYEIVRDTHKQREKERKREREKEQESKREESEVVSHTQFKSKTRLTQTRKVFVFSFFFLFVFHIITLFEHNLSSMVLRKILQNPLKILLVCYRRFLSVLGDSRIV